MESVYLETTLINYLVARPSRDLIVAGHQQITQEWWANRHSEFECRVSQVVVDEASVGDPAAAVAAEPANSQRFQHAPCTSRMPWMRWPATAFS
jgi:hypothetical protein